MVTIRDATPEEREKFGQKRTGLLRDVVVVDGERIIGYGAMMQFVEVQLEVFGSELDRGRAFLACMNEAIGEAVRRNVGEIHAFTSDPAFAHVLKKRFGFTHDGEYPLTLEIPDGLD